MFPAPIARESIVLRRWKYHRNCVSGYRWSDVVPGVITPSLPPIFFAHGAAVVCMAVAEYCTHPAIAIIADVPCCWWWCCCPCCCPCCPCCCLCCCFCPFWPPGCLCSQFSYCRHIPLLLFIRFMSSESYRWCCSCNSSQCFPCSGSMPNCCCGCFGCCWCRKMLLERVAGRRHALLSSREEHLSRGSQIFDVSDGFIAPKHLRDSENNYAPRNVVPHSRKW